MGTEAWVTVSVDDNEARRALTLAGSLRKVCTFKKLVVFIHHAVGKDLRLKLKSAFDWVVEIEMKTPNGYDVFGDYAKMEALSLTIFTKCVLLSPNMLVMNNCDDVFRKHGNFAAPFLNDYTDEIDPSIFVFVPGKEYQGIFEEIMRQTNSNKKPFASWLENKIAGLEKLDEKYNMKLSLQGKNFRQLDSEICIVNFVDDHPLDHPEKLSDMPTGSLEKFAAEYCWDICTNLVEQSKMEMGNRIFELGKSKSEPIAIVGMSFRLPGANNVDELWSLLSEGRSAVVPVPRHRWTKEHTLCPSRNEKVKAGFLTCPVDEMDAAFFGHSAQDAEYLDPQKRLLLEVTWEALENALIDPTMLRGTKTGVFAGSWIQEYHEMVLNSVDDEYFRRFIGNSVASSAAKIAHLLGTTGPCIGTDNGCSASMAAVDLACKSLRQGGSDVAVAAGVNLLLRPFDHDTFEAALSPSYVCRTFDANADGYARAEGCTVLILKRLSDAVKDDDNIWGLIRGSAMTQEGGSKSMGTPTVECESLAMKLALEDADVKPYHVSYVEAHGTGTVVGDPIEVSAIQRAFSHGRTQPLLIGSVKTNLGHTEGASGITGIIKVLLSMKHGFIPKHLNLETLNPKINLKAIPAKIPTRLTPWPRVEGRPRIAGVNSFGISGTDGHALIEEAPTILKPKLEVKEERPLHLMKISAKSQESLDTLLQNYLDLFRTVGNDTAVKNFADFAYSANVGRATFHHRAVITASNISEAVEQLEKKLFLRGDVQSKGEKICFLFTGQGSQYPNMGQILYETSPVFRSCLDQCDAYLQQRYSIFIRDVMWPGTNSPEGEKLNRTLYSQTSIFVLEYCLLKLWESWGVKPDYVVGHSLGEFAAAVAAGALRLEDAIMLVAERSRLIDNLQRGKMLVIKADKQTVDETIRKFQQTHLNFWVDYAALNASDQTVIAGDCKWIEEFSAFCTSNGLKNVVLAATHAFHSRHMDLMLEKYRKVASSIRKPKSSNSNSPIYVSGMEGKILKLDMLDAQYWVNHTREKVNFVDACKTLKMEGCKLFLEIGPHPVLSPLTMRNLEKDIKTKCMHSLRRNENCWSTMLDTLATLYLSEWKGEIDWKGFDRFYKRNKMILPFYPFNRKSIWKQFERIPPKIHPLIGRLNSTATKETIFYNAITFKNINFVSEHVIGSAAIFPGAGFLEMCLVGGHAAVERYTENVVTLPKRPISLKYFQILSPMSLHETGVCRLQTIVKLHDQKDDHDVNEGIGWIVEVHRQTDADNNPGKWIKHASANFIPTATTLLSQNLINDIDISKIQTTWQEWDGKKSYEGLPEIGLKFGPKFQSLETGWRSSNGMLISLKVPQDFQKYLIHPIIGDAMIQAILLWQNRDSTTTTQKLHVPVKIKEFIWLKEAKSANQFVYCSNDEEKNDICCLLLDEEGSTLAYMGGVDFIKTTSKLVVGMLEQQTSKMPKIWEEVWKPSRGPMQGYLTYDTPIHNLDMGKDEQILIHQLNSISDEENKFFGNMVLSSKYLVLRAFFNLGWCPKQGQTFSAESLMQTLKIKDGFKEYVYFFLQSIAGDDFSLHESNRLFQFLKIPPTLEKLENTLNQLAVTTDKTRTEYQLMRRIGEELDKVFTGEADPLSLLFPIDPTKPSAGKLYEDLWKILNSSIYPMEPYVRQHLSNSSTSAGHTPVYRILEIGAGTGACTKTYLNQIIPSLISSKHNYDVEYYITDISPSFFDPIRKSLSKEQLQSVEVVFKKYDMDMDPLEQGLFPGYFDLITASKVFHIAKDIKTTMKSIRSLLKPGGMLLFLETLNTNVYNTFLFGLLPEFWHFTDREFRGGHNNLTFDMWKKALDDSGFHRISHIPLYNNMYGVIAGYASHAPNNNFLRDLYLKNKSWLIFTSDQDHYQLELCNGLKQKLKDVGRTCTLISLNEIPEFNEKAVTDHFTKLFEEVGNVEGALYLWPLSTSTSIERKDQKQVSLPFLTLMKLISERCPATKVFALMKGACTMDTCDVIDPNPATIIGFCKSLFNENTFLNANYFDLDPNKEIREQIDEVFMNLWVEHKQGCAFRNGLRLIPKFKAAHISGNEPLSLPNTTNRFQLQLPDSRLIGDLEFIPLAPYFIADGEVEVETKAVALNFRDVFAVSKPNPDFETFNTACVDFAGVISKVGGNVSRFKVGDRVMGISVDDGISLPSHRKVPESRLIPLPTTMTFTEGATLPIAFCTATQCLLNVAKMKKGETVLIHTASGGVGLVAVQLCKYIGANVIATAGSKRKQNYLKNLGIKHVFHSRTTDFSRKVLEVTRGRRVNIVLNSITGPGFKEASLDCLAKNGRFIEMSKLNVWSKAEVNARRPDVIYQRVDLTKSNEQEIKALMEQLESLTETDWIKPIPYEIFDAVNICAALNHLQAAKHIGKVVCTMPEVKIGRSEMNTYTPLFSSNSTYLITGGLGGIGFEIANERCKTYRPNW